MVLTYEESADRGCERTRPGEGGGGIEQTGGLTREHLKCVNLPGSVLAAHRPFQTWLQSTE